MGFGWVLFPHFVGITSQNIFFVLVTTSQSKLECIGMATSGTRALLFIMNECKSFPRVIMTVIVSDVLLPVQPSSIGEWQCGVV